MLSTESISPVVISPEPAAPLLVANPGMAANGDKHGKQLREKQQAAAQKVYHGGINPKKVYSFNANYPETGDDTWKKRFENMAQMADDLRCFNAPV